MSKNKNFISKAESYKEIGEFWDIHDLADYWDKTKSVEFEIGKKRYCGTEQARNRSHWEANAA